MFKKLVFLTLISLVGVQVIAQNTVTLDEYIEKWSPVAVKHKDLHGIPASITLAQGILESGFGNSKLAQEGNNHFGIKCHDWSGKTIFKDDDKKDECFRKYTNAEQSYEDHADFLTSRKRYSELFELEVTNYKGWAKGLKKAGYATNSKYPKLLINLIKKHELYKFDTEEYEEWEHKELLSERNATLPIENDKTQKEEKKSSREIELNNKLKFVKAKEGDTFYQIAKEMGLTLRQLHNYNDFPKNKDHLVEGDIVYLMPKKNRANRNNKHITIEDDMAAWEISQKYGIKLNKIMSVNNITKMNERIAKGTKISLR